MSDVTNMVCPLCARLHGRPHADGCPKDYGGQAAPVYLAGYEAGAEQRFEVAELVASTLDRTLVAAVENRVLSDDAADVLRGVLASQGLLAS